MLREHDVLCAVSTARGCPYKCTYCASSLLSNGFRARDPAKVLDEIAYWIDRYNCKNIAFYDDALLYRADERVIPLLEGIRQRNIVCNFHTPNGLHARAITREIAGLLYQTGFKTLRLGFETSDDALQARTGGKITCREFEQAVHHLRNAGYAAEEIGVYLLAGLPGQGMEDITGSVRFVRDCGARPFRLNILPSREPGCGTMHVNTPRLT